MKKILKKSIEIILKFVVLFLSKINLGRFILEELNKNILNNKKVIIYKDSRLKFYTPNRLSYYRIDTFCTKEPETLEWIDKFEKKTTFWDVGANIGLYSCYAAKSKECQVYAFEPSIFNLEWLGRNIFLNNLVKKIVVIPIPLTEMISESTLNFSSTEWSGALTTFGQSFGHDGKALKKVFEFSTLGISMNDAKNFLKIPQPDYLKIDVDGIEHLILKCGEKILSNTREVLIEVNERFEQQKNNCTKYLKKLGFNLKEKKNSDLLFKDTEFLSVYNQIWIK